MNNELEKYVIDARKAGKNDEIIKKELLDSGWKEKDISTAITAKKEVKKGKGMKRFIIIILAITVAAMIGFAAFVYSRLDLPSRQVSLACKQGGGKIKKFSDSCGDTCRPAPDRLFGIGPGCATVFAFSCDCGPKSCWDGSTCVLDSSGR